MVWPPSHLAGHLKICMLEFRKIKYLSGAPTMVLQFLLVAGEEDVGDDDGSTHEDDAEQHDVGLPIAEEVVVGPAPTSVPVTLIIVTILCVVIIIIIRCILKICLYWPNLPSKIVNVLNIGLAATYKHFKTEF